VPYENQVTRIARRLQGEIQQLLQEAAQIEQAANQVDRGGNQTFETLEAALAIADDIERICPTRAAMEAWHSIALEAADRQWAATLEGFGAQFGHPEAKPQRATAISLVWAADARIDVARSAVQNRQVIPTRPTAPAMAVPPLGIPAPVLGPVA